MTEAEVIWGDFPCNASMPGQGPPYLIMTDVNVLLSRGASRVVWKINKVVSRKSLGEASRNVECDKEKRGKFFDMWEKQWEKICRFKGLAEWKLFARKLTFGCNLQRCWWFLSKRA